MFRVLRRPHALLRALLVVCSSLLLVTCAESPIGPRGRASLIVRPRYDASVRFAPLVIDRARLVVADPASDGPPLLDKSKAFAPGSQQISFDETVPLTSASLDVLVTLELYAGQVLLFSGQTTVTLRQSQQTRPAEPLLVYGGPGALATVLTLAPRDSTVRTGTTFLMRATAADAQQQPVPDFYLHWSVAGGTGATIDAAGTLVTGSARGTLLVKAVMPNGVTDSTRVLVVPAPAALVKQSGDGQSGTTGARLAQPLAVLVNGGDGQPVPGVTVTFAVASGGGSVDSATATSDAQGIARTGVTLGGTVGQQSFSASSAGLAAVTFTATAAAPSNTVTWTGAADNSWNNPANWTPKLPDATSDVVIPVTATSPVLFSAVGVHNLTLAANAGLDLGGFVLVASGSVAADGAISGFGTGGLLQLTGAGQTLHGRIDANVTVSGSYALDGRLACGQNSNGLFTLRVAGSLDLAGHTADLRANFATNGTGTLRMANALDSMLVTRGAFNGGGAAFAGGSTAGLLTNGTLRVVSLAQSGTGSVFAPSGNHLTILSDSLGGGGSVNLTDPVNSGFQNLDLRGAGISVASDVVVKGTLTAGTTPNGSSALGFSGGNVITAAGVNVSALAVNGGRFVIQGGPIVRFDSVRFNSTPTTVAQLTVNHPGAATPFTFQNLQFNNVPVAPNGFYLSATDTSPADGVPLAINMVNPLPAFPGAFVQTAGGATVSWGTTTRTWNGSVSSDWSVAANWTPAQVPTNANDVVIPSGTVNGPIVTNSCSALTLTVNTGAALSLGNFNCQVGGNVFADGSITGSGAVQLATTAQIRGALPNLIVSGPVTLAGNVTLSGNLTVSNGDVTLNGHGAVISGNLQTQGSGTVTMTNPADQFTVLGSISFAGGSTTGKLTAGVIVHEGLAFAQSGTATSYAPSGTHRINFTNSAVTVGFADPVNSGFQDLNITGTTITLQSDIRVKGTLIAGAGLGPAKITSATTRTVTTGGVNVGDLIVDRAALVIGSGTITQFDSVQFTNSPTTSAQLTVNNPGAATPFTFSNLVFTTLPTAPNGFYLDATDPDGATSGVLTLNLLTPTPATPGGFVRTAGGAVVNWPSVAPVVITWTGANSIQWTDPGNWSLNRVPAATDSVVIPNGVTTFPTLVGRATVGAMFEDGRLTINGGALQVTRGIAANTGINRIISLTNPTDSLIVGGSVGAPVSALAGVVVVGGDITVPGNFTGATLLLNGNGPQTVAGSGAGNVPFGYLLVAKPAGTATLGAGSLFNGDSAFVQSGSLAGGTPLSVVNGFRSAAGTSVNLTGSLTVGTALTIGGSYSVGTTVFTLPGAPTVIQIPVLPYSNLTVQGGSGTGTAVLTGRTTVTGNLLVTSSGTAGASLVLNGKTLAVTGNLLVNGLGPNVVSMTNPLDSLIVNGSGTFSSAVPSSPGNMTAGTFVLAGDFSETQPFGGANFQATGTHTTVLTGASPTVTFAAPGTAANQNRFANLTWTGTGTLNLGSGVTVSGALSTTATAPVTLLGNIASSRFLQFATIAAGGPLTFNQVRVIVAQSGTGTAVGLGNATFVNLASDVTQLTIQHPGITGGSVVLPNLTFSSVPTTGFYISATDVAPTDGIPLVVDLTNPNPATSGGFVQQNSATINWPAVAPAVTWNGSAGTAWTTAANWTPAQVPTGATDVTIPAGAPSFPVVSANAAVRSLTVATGASLNVTGGTFTVNGDIDAPGTILVDRVAAAFNPAGAARTIRGNIQNVNVLGTYQANGALTLGQDLIVRGTFAPGGNTVDVGGNFSSFSAGVLSMTNPADVVIVRGNALFAGGSTAGTLTAGVLEVKGNLSQNNTGTGFPANSFSASGSHTTKFTGTVTQQVDIFNSGTGTAASHFANIDVSGAVGVGFARVAPTIAEGQLISLPAGAAPVVGSAVGARLSVGGVNVNGLTVNSLPLIVGSGAITRFDKVTFATFAATDTQLTVNHPGAAAPFVFDQLTFSTVPSGGGLYLRANDTDGAVPNALTINLSNPTPATAAGLTQATNGAVINWPGTAPAVWTGAISGDFANGANWSTGVVPTMATDVTIPSTFNFAPQLLANQVVRNLTVNAGATINLNDAGLGVFGSLASDGDILANTGVLVLGGTGQTLRGTVEANTTVSGSYTLNGRFTFAPNFVGRAIAVSGSLDLTGQTASIRGDFTTSNAGVVKMTSGVDSLIVTGTAVLAGGSTSGLLTAGTFVLGGDLTTAVGSGTAFAPSGTHKTVLSGAAHNIAFFTSGSGAAGSHFQALDLSQMTGTVTLGTPIFVDGALIAAGTTVDILGGGNALTARQWQVNGLNVENTLMTLDEQGTAGTEQFDNVGFTGYSATGATQMKLVVPGGAAAARPLGFSNLLFEPKAIGGGSFYLDVTATTGSLTVNLPGSNQGTTANGNGPALTKTTGTVTVNWP